MGRCFDINLLEFGTFSSKNWQFYWKAFLLKSFFIEKLFYWKAFLLKSFFIEKLFYWKAFFLQNLLHNFYYFIHFFCKNPNKNPNIDTLSICQKSDYSWHTGRRWGARWRSGTCLLRNEKINKMKMIQGSLSGPCFPFYKKYYFPQVPQSGANFLYIFSAESDFPRKIPWNFLKKNDFSKLFPRKIPFFPNIFGG
jgi:hypothetical protein